MAAVALALGQLTPRLAGAEPTSAAPVVKRNFPQEIAKARDAWNGDSKRIAELLRILREQVGILAPLEKELAAARKELAALMAEKAQALEDLRNGAFCTGCNRTRSELLAKGEGFPHPGQQSRPATPEELARAENDYDARIGRLRARVNDLENRFKAAKSKLDNAHHELNVTIPRYHKDLLAERDLRMREWSAEWEEFDRQLDSLQQAAEAAAKAVKQAQGGDAAEAAEMNLRIQGRQLDETAAKARAAEGRARQQAQSFVTTARGDLDRLAKLAENLPATFGLPGGWFLARQIGIPPLAMDYTVAAVRCVETPSGGDGVRDLLGESGTKSRAPQPEKDSPKSMRDLLEGQ
ncbi:MAG: hypothetical protein ACOZE5_03620 [Verrucomicrobiota bacterium]